MIAIITFGVFIVLTIVCLYFARKEYTRTLYFYPKNKHFYSLRYKCRIKNPTSGEWVDAVIYQDTKSRNYYARKSSDFFAKFVNYKDFDLNEYN